MHINDSLTIAKTVFAKKGEKISIAHNGSSLAFVKKIAPYLEYAAIDLKAASGMEFSERAGLASLALGQKMLENSLRVQSFLTKECGILVDVRTCVFSDTTIDDMLEIAKLISLNNDISKVFWTVRGYNPVKGVAWRKPNRETLLANLELVASAYPSLKIGYRDKWAGENFRYYNCNF